MGWKRKIGLIPRKPYVLNSWSFKAKGKPLWHGRMKIIARAATLAEKVAYRRKSVEKSFADEDHNPDDALALLVPVKEATTMTRTS